MARPSPGTQRVIAILNLLATNRGKAFSLTDLINNLKMNRSTCHSLVNELVDAGYLYRTHDKLYVLGPAAGRLGQAAGLHTTPLDVALPEMHALANRHDAICSAIFRDGADVVVRERAASVSHLDWTVDRGMRWPLRPPFGGIFLAWSSDSQVEAWFEALDPPPSPAERARTREGMAFARGNGFQFTERLMPAQGDETSMDWIFVRDPAQRPLEIGTSLENDRSYALTSMSAPVFGQHDQVIFALSLTGFSGYRSGKEIFELGRELRTACDKITSFSRI